MLWPERACVVCGAMFTPTDRRQKLCSAACAKQRQKWQKASRYYTLKDAGRCVQCGKPLRREETTHCHKCRERIDEWHKKNRKETPRRPMVCGMCGAAFTPTASSQRFCSAACAKQRLHERQWAYRKNRKAARGGGQYEPLTERACIVCGTMFTPVTSRHRCCSAACTRRRNDEQRAARYQALKAARRCIQCRKPLEPWEGMRCKECENRNRRKEEEEKTCPNCRAVYYKQQEAMNECPVCGWLFREPIEGIDTPPADAVRFHNLELAPDAMRRLLNLRRQKEANGEIQRKTTCDDTDEPDSEERLHDRRGRGWNGYDPTRRGTNQRRKARTRWHG